MVKDNREMVRFVRHCSPYLTGETAAFNTRDADKLVARGVAVRIDRPVSSQVEIDSVDEDEDDDSVEQADDDADAGEGSRKSGKSKRSKKKGSGKKKRVKADADE